MIKKKDNMSSTQADSAMFPTEFSAKKINHRGKQNTYLSLHMPKKDKPLSYISNYDINGKALLLSNRK